MTNLNAVNVFLKSKTPEGLIALQVLNNILNNVQHTYTIPVWDGKQWFVWFFADVTTWQDPSLLKEEEKKFLGKVNV